MNHRESPGITRNHQRNSRKGPNSASRMSRSTCIALNRLRFPTKRCSTYVHVPSVDLEHPSISRPQGCPEGSSARNAASSSVSAFSFQSQCLEAVAGGAGSAGDGRALWLRCVCKAFLRVPSEQAGLGVAIGLSCCCCCCCRCRS